MFLKHSFNFGKQFFGIFAILFSASSLVYGQSSDTTGIKQQSLSEVTVTASRIDQKDLQSILPISKVGKTLLQNGQPLLTADEGLQYIPGVFTLNNTNFAQDLRVSIRGFGARAAFGIRGIQLLVDGLPETTPDGQAQVDNLELGILQSVEVIRGPSSGLYGNASGGVISYTTENPTEQLTLESQMTLGSYNFQRYQFKVGQQLDKVGFFFNASRTSLDGFRDHSRNESNLFNGKLHFDLSSNQNLKVVFNYLDSPQADDPGGINLDQASNAPASARDRNVLFNAGEAISQGKIGLVYDWALNKNQSLQATTYYIFRDFAGFLPFENGGRVKFNRSFYGATLNHQWKKDFKSSSITLKSGIEFGQQEDDRTRFDNLEGIEGDLTLDQQESFQSLGIFHLQEWVINEKLILSGGLRFDINTLEVSDNFLTNGNNSGNQTLNSLNPSIGMNYEFNSGLRGFARISSSFETPTLGELSNNPTGAGGFNPDLEPQKAVNYELGLKGTIQEKLKYELAVFHIDLTNEIIPFELSDFPGRTFYQNTGNSSRNGVEWNTQYNFAPGWNAYLNYTFSDFQFEDFVLEGTNLDGKKTPGIPQHNGFFGITYLNKSGLFLSSQLRVVGSLFANNENSVEVDSYSLLNLRASYNFTWSSFEFAPFIGLNNVTDASYNANIRINAFGNRFFEPAPDFNVYGGIKLKWRP